MKKLEWFFAEFMVVVTGVLVAFALNSWWMDVKDANKEEAYLEQLMADIDTSIEMLEEALEFETNATMASAELLKYYYSRELPHDTILSNAASRCMSFDPGSVIQSTLFSLVNSGDLQLISNDSIKTELALLSGELVEYEELRKSITTEMLMTGFKDFSSTLSVFDLYLSDISEEDYERALQDSLLPLPQREDFRRPEPLNWKELYQNEEFIQQAAFIYVAHNNMRRVHRDAHQYLESSKERIASFMTED